MNWLSYIIWSCLLFSISSDAKKRRQTRTKPGIWHIDNPTTVITNKPNTNLSTTSELPNENTRNVSENEIKYVMVKTLSIPPNKNKCYCNCSHRDEVNTTEKNPDIDETSKHPISLKVTIKNKPEKYPGRNNTISKRCPYFVPNENFKMHKLADVFWPKFYNMKEPLNCFKIRVMRLTDMEKKRNEFLYGNFGGKIDWTRCYFEIQPPDTVSEMRHFLLGDANDQGVMRNILITTVNGGYSFQEEMPDQWLMLRNLVVLRDCTTGEVVVFTRTPQMTSTGDIVEALQDLGEEMIGNLLCDEDDLDWLDAIS